MNRSRVPLRFLIVEDEALLAMDIEMMIEDGGHRVVAEAACLDDVVALADTLAFDVALVDLQLARGSSGIDVCAFLRAHWKDAVIVFLTANPKKLPSDYAGGHGVLSKPFSRAGLMSALRYIEEGLRDPPPSSSPPADLVLAPAMARRWAA